MNKILEKKYKSGSYCVYETNNLSESVKSKKVVEKHEITCQMGIFLRNLPKEDINDIKDLIEDGFYYEATIPISFILNREFLSEYIKSSNSFILYSLNTPTPPCNSVYIVRGIMYLYVDKDSYQTIGLNGRKVNNNYYIMIINLKHLNNSFYERLLYCLSDTRMNKVTVTMSYTDCKSCKSLPINIPSNYQSKLINNKISITEYNSIEIPDFENINLKLENNKPIKDEENEIKNLNNIFDYFGLIECNIDDVLSGNEKDSYISSFNPMNEYVCNCEDGIHIKCEGVFSSLLIFKLIKILNEIIKSKHLLFYLLSLYGLNNGMCLKELKSEYIKKEEEIEDNNIHLISFEDEKSIIYCV